MTETHTLDPSGPARRCRRPPSSSTGRACRRGDRGADCGRSGGARRSANVTVLGMRAPSPPSGPGPAGSESGARCDTLAHGSVGSAAQRARGRAIVVGAPGVVRAAGAEWRRGGLSDWSTQSGEHEHALDEIAELRARPDGIVWIDIPEWNDEAEQAADDRSSTSTRWPSGTARSATRCPKVHVYEDHVFLVLHAPEEGAAGHVHYVELDQFVGDRFLITVHGPLNPAVAPEQARWSRSTSVLHRLDLHKLQPKTSFELSYALVSALTGRLRDYLADAHPGGLAAGAARHRRSSGRPGEVPGRDVPGPPRAADGADDVRR